MEMADTGKAAEGNLAIASTAPVNGRTNWTSQIRNSTTAITHAVTSGRGARPLSPCRFFLRRRCRYGCRCGHLDVRTVPSQKPCKHFQRGHCKFGQNCKFSHVIYFAASTTTLSQRKRDEEQECGICLEKVLAENETPGQATTSKFGILQNCNHCFCLPCIKKWRTSEDGRLEMRKTYPVCRTPSDFIIPSEHWVETPGEKKKLRKNFKKVVKSKPCRYSRRGRGVCPNGTECTYLHALPDVTEVEGNEDYDHFDERNFVLELSTSIADVLELFVRDMRIASTERQSS
ncbi:E3 ubiquitin-protein ligase makorin-1 [Elysia marginata]|uniref:RING-type E3 ubiquitin transferase n=1 Tax=Elysia marginata TaxID=1093978 RepID=A0AAV4I7J1_9GAST|nr:E3 ubiquitin-protein ligase makorin-1 [Elysia marginata]